jgi:hypothetical protein
MKYVYAYCDPQKPVELIVEGVSFNHEPFYVGKGTKNRIRVHLCPSRHTLKLPLYAKIAKMCRNGISPVIVECKQCETDKEACDWESKLIKAIGRRDTKTGTLANLTDGGEGCWSMSDSVKIKRSARRLNVSEAEYAEHFARGERRCIACRNWFDEGELRGSHCKNCRNEKLKVERHNAILKKCGGNQALVELCRANTQLLHVIERRGITPEEYLKILSDGKNICRKCKNVVKADDFTNGMCRECSNEYSRCHSKEMRGYDKDVERISSIVGNTSLAEAVLQAAKRQKIDIAKYARNVADNKRYCPVCKSWKSKDEFWANKTRTLGVQHKCRGCSD